jgi:hypothetical protein
MFENLNVAADLFASTKFTGSSVDEIRDQLISTTRFLVNNNLSTTEDWNLADGFHESVLDILWPDLFIVFLSRIRSLPVSSNTPQTYSFGSDLLSAVWRSKGIELLCDSVRFAQDWDW